MMDASDPIQAIILTRRQDIREAVRQSMKSFGLKPAALLNCTEEKELNDAVQEHAYTMLVLDWEFGIDTISRILERNRREHQAEAHPVFLLAAHEDEAIIAFAQEYFIQAIAIGQVTMDDISEQVKTLVRDFQNTSPIRKMLLAVEKARQKGELHTTIDLLEKVLLKQSDNLRVVVELAESYIHNSEWKKAEELLQPFKHRDGAGARIKQLYARCRLKQGDTDGAIEALKDAQLLSPYNFERLLELGHVFLKNAQPDEAEESFDEALELAPSAKSAQLGKSTSKLLKGEINEALLILNEFANPRELSSVFNTAAILAIQQKDFKAGFDLYQKALQILQKKPILLSRIYYNMGIGFVKSGKLDKATKCFEKSNEQDPAFHGAIHNLKILKAAAQIPSKSPTDAAHQQEVLEGLEERFTSSMPMIDVTDSESAEEVQLDDVLADLHK